MFKNIFFTFFLFFLPNILFANFCSDFENYLKNRIETKEVIFSKDKWESFGVTMNSDVNKETISKKISDDVYEYPLSRDINNNILIKSVVYDGPFHKAGIRHFDRLVKINNREISEMSDDVFHQVFDSFAKEDEINFTFQLTEKNDTGEYFIRSGFEETEGYTDIIIKSELIEWPNDIYSVLIPIDLIEVRPEKYQLDLEYITNISYYDLQSSEFVDQYGLDEYVECSFNLSPNENAYEEYNLFNPQIIKKNFIEDKSTSQNLLNFSIYPKTDQEPSSIWLTITQRKISTFSQYLDFYLFPFEKHNVKIDLEPYYSFYTLDNNINEYADNIVFYADDLIYGKFTPGFEIIKTDYGIYTDDSYEDNMVGNIVVTFIEIERRSFYFVAKIVAPIFLILLLSWSVFFLKPKDIESRLTVSIICFLSLIAYNFVIEDSIPKLNYYTWMDWYVSFSYIFCGLTTFFTIYDYQLINKKRKQFKFTEAMRSSGIFIFILLNFMSFYLLKIQDQGYF